MDIYNQTYNPSQGFKQFTGTLEEFNKTALPLKGWIPKELLSAEEKEKIVAAKIDLLWQAAHDYEYAQISGSAIGMLAIGVVLQKPKSLAVAAWIKQIWDDNYYIRKAQVTFDEPVNLDFSNCGPIPHTVPELIAEVSP